MADNFTERLTLLITVDPGGAVGVLKGFGDTAKSELQKVETSATTSGRKAGQNFGDGLTDGAKTALAAFEAIVAGLGARKIISFGRDSIDEAIEFNRANAELSAAIQGVGASAGVTEQQVAHLSDRIESQQAIFKGEVREAAALLLSLGDIKNQQGAGNEIFNRALSLSAALSNVFGKELAPTANQLGRALENPARGLQALSRSGIPLSPDTFAKVEGLAKRGDILGAQKALLDDLEARYLAVGEAAAKADPIQQLNVQLDEFKTKVGGDLLPGLQLILSGVQGIFGGFEHLPLPIRGSVEALVAFAAVAVPLSKLRDVLGSINTLAGTRAAVVAPAATGATGAAAGQGEVSAANASEGESATRAAGQTGALNAQLQKTASVAPQAASGMIEVDGALATVGETSASVLSELNALETSLVAMGFAPEKVAAALAQTRQEMLGLETPIAEVNAELAVTEAQIEGMIAQLGALAPVAAETGVALAGVATKASTLGTVSGAGLQSLDATLIKAGIDADVLALAMARVSGAEVEATASTVELMTTEELLTERARLLAKAQEEAGLSIRGFLGSFSGVAGFLGGAFIANSILDQIGNHSPDVTRLGKSIEVFGKTGEASGTLKDALNDLDPRILKINSDLSDLQKVPGINLPGVKQLFSVGEKGGLALTGQIGASNTAKATLKELDDEMARLTDSGNIQDANALFQLLSSTMGGTFEDFPKFKQALDDFTASQEAMANGTADANTILAQQASVFEDLATKFELQKGLDSVSAAQKQVRDDYADIAGTSAKAKEADRAEASAKHALADANRGVVDAQQSLSDSYVRVSDAQEKVGDSSRRLADAQHSLLEAEQELALFNSAKGAQERALALDIIKRRVVTNPIEAEQKQLDLLKFGDDNAKKQQDLQDRVHSAQEGVADATRGVRDALRGVADAQRAVVRAEQGVEDATYRVRDAHDRVTEAAEKRKRVSLDASEQIKADIDKEQEALLQVVSSLERAVANGQVLPEDTEKWVGKLQAAADKMNGPVSAAVDNLANKVKALDLNAGAIGSGSFAPSSFLSSSFTGPRSTDEQRLFLEASGSYTGPISAADRKKLHDLNVPGFATGGFVPGPLGLPSLAIVHGGEQVLTPQQQRDRAGNGGQVVQVHQENHFHGGDTPTTADLEYANRALGWRLSQTGRSG